MGDEARGMRYEVWGMRYEARGMRYGVWGMSVQNLKLIDFGLI